MTPPFVATNILICALGTDAKAPRARAIYEGGCRVSVQCFNEFANVARRKLKLGLAEVVQPLADIRQRCFSMVAVGETIHTDGRLTIADPFV